MCAPSPANTMLSAALRKVSMSPLRQNDTASCRLLNALARWHLPPPLSGGEGTSSLSVLESLWSHDHDRDLSDASHSPHECALSGGVARTALEPISLSSSMWAGALLWSAPPVEDVAKKIPEHFGTLVRALVCRSPRWSPGGRCGPAVL